MRGKASLANSANDYYTKNKYKCKVPKKKNNRKIKKICLFYNKNHPKIAFILTVHKVFS